MKKASLMTRLLPSLEPRLLPSLVAILLLTFLLSACGTKLMPADSNQALIRSNLFLEQSIATKPTSISGSIRLSDASQSLRLNYILWSNGSYPLRIDLMHSQAGIMAKILEEQNQVLIYTPENNEVNVLHASSDNLMINNIPLPFGLENLNNLMQGQSLAVFRAPKLSEVYQLDKDIMRFQVAKGTIDINPQGQVVAWQEDKNKGWTLNIEYSPHGLPTSLKFLNFQEQSVSIYIKSVQNYDLDYSPEKLELALPNNVIVKDIKAKL